MPDTTDILLVLGVAGARLLVPLAIPKYPLPASLASIVADLADGTIAFAAFSRVGLTDYQAYDKAFDTYYLTIQYLSTLRNWDNGFAFTLGRFLFYFRLAGGTLFEFTRFRPLMLVFPNTFEYFFLLYEAVGLRWDPRRLSRAWLLRAAIAIWVFVKLPQEYWIHIAQFDTGDVKRILFRAPADAPWGEIVTQRPATVATIVAAAVALVVVGRWIIVKAAPPPDWPLTFDADAHGAIPDREARGARRDKARSDRIAAIVEKTALVSVLTIFFSRMLPNLTATAAQTAMGVALVIAANLGVSEWLVRRGVHWQSAFVEIVAMTIVNSAIAAAFAVALPLSGGKLELASLFLVLLLLTVLITLYDRYRPIHLARRDRARAVEPG